MLTEGILNFESILSNFIEICRWLFPGIFLFILYCLLKLEMRFEVLELGLSVFQLVYEIIQSNLWLRSMIID